MFYYGTNHSNKCISNLKMFYYIILVIKMNKMLFMYAFEWEITITNNKEMS